MTFQCSFKRPPSFEIDTNCRTMACMWFEPYEQWNFFCSLVHGIIKLHFSPTLTKYFPLSPCILLDCIFHSSHLLMASFTPNYLLAFRVHFSPFVIKHLKASSPLATKSISSKKKFTSDRVLYQLNPAYLPLFEQAPPFPKLVAPPILTSIVIPIVTCRGSVQKKFELMEIALGD